MVKRLLFVSPLFLLPADSGGKIRTSQILRRLRGGAFEVTLCSPTAVGQAERQRDELAALCDRFVPWPAAHRGALFRLTRMRHLLSPLPIPVRTDRAPAGRRTVAEQLSSRPDVVVFDFPHSTVLAPRRIPIPSVCFTHNVEAEIFKRHLEIAADPLRRAVWRNQHRKMRRFERRTLARFDRVITVSERDAAYFRDSYGLTRVSTIPTGVDLDYFTYRGPGDSAKVVFTGSMDWMANVDGMEWLLREVWPRVLNSRPDARLIVIGKNPPARLVELAGRRTDFTGFVDDIRTHLAGAAACVIPLRVGGGTRIKAFEAMASGYPVVSTTIGVEGLPLEAGEHYLRADDSAGFAAALVRLLSEPELRRRMARSAREHVESNFSNDRVAEVFEQICLQVVSGQHR